jgi:hypothetical protein
MTLSYIIDTTFNPHRITWYLGQIKGNLAIWDVSGDILTIQASGGDTTTFPPAFTNPSHYLKQTKFVVVTSSPADGAVAVPMSTTICFYFSSPLDTSRHFPHSWNLPISLSIEPRNSTAGDSVFYYSNFRTMCIQVTHHLVGDYVWRIDCASDNTGQSLSQPYVINYTTIASHGNYTVSGRIVVGSGNAVNALVALLKYNLAVVDTGYWLNGSVVLDTSGNYVFKYVRDGVYWPVYVKDSNSDCDLNFPPDQFGFYDPNHDYYPDSIVVSGSSIYQIDMTPWTTGVEDQRNTLPYSFSLQQNYPNPFNPITTIEYQVPTRSHVSLRVFDVLGIEVATLVNVVEDPGYKSVNFNVNGLASGVYFYRLQAGSFSETKKLILLR